MNDNVCRNCDSVCLLHGVILYNNCIGTRLYKQITFFFYCNFIYLLIKIIVFFEQDGYISLHSHQYDLHCSIHLKECLHKHYHCKCFYKGMFLLLLHLIFTHLTILIKGVCLYVYNHAAL